MNQALVLRCIRDNPEISRIETAKLLGLDRSTITNIITPLIANGVVVEAERGSSTNQGGRRPIGLKINSHWGFVLGFEFEPDSWTCVTLSLTASVVSQEHHPFRQDYSTEAILELVQGVLKKSHHKIIGISIGISGLVNPERGQIIESWALDMHGVELGMFLEKAVDIPVLIENDANCCAWGELESSDDSFIFLLPRFREKIRKNGKALEGGIGLGIVLGGKVFYGPHFAAGEFRSIFHREGDHYQLGVKEDELNRLYDDMEVFRKVTEEILLNLSVVVSILHPKKLIMGGSFRGREELISEILGEDLKDYFIGNATRPCTIQFSKAGDAEVAIGAARKFLHLLFELPSTEHVYPNEIKWNKIIDLVGYAHE